MMESEIEHQPTPVVFFDGKWLVGGLIAFFQEERQRLHEEVPGISPVLPAQCLDPELIAGFLGVSLVEMDWPGPALFITRQALERIEAKLDAQGAERGLAAQADYLSIKEAAGVSRLPYSHVRRAVLAGELPASNVGSDSHAVYGIARSDLTAWMNTKKGGVRLPPRSTLKELVKRHLPIILQRHWLVK